LRAENKDGKLMWQQVSSILMAMVEKEPEVVAAIARKLNALVP
jgi:hypothetical protein